MVSGARAGALCSRRDLVAQPPAGAGSAPDPGPPPEGQQRPLAAGVLAVQGSFAAHARALARLGVEPRLVRRAEDLEGLRYLILPGGESTVLSHFLEQQGFGAALAARLGSGELAALGTCAGAILLGREPAGGGPRTGRQPVRLGLAPVEVERNAYGRQLDSFRGPVELAGSFAAFAARLAAEPSPRAAPPPERFEGVFIRAPRFVALGPEVEVLGRHGGEPVLVRWRRLVLAAFHPELTADLRLHRYLLEEL
ncbi:MAG: pyridoxal 5'-phosphate synthase subunit PdxT [Planctomycetota bacterium]|nr:MAG: pyridoxal 5'-phosphate synthase subunit PdxT [Planctomycetota bacterium]